MDAVHWICIGGMAVTFLIGLLSGMSFSDQRWRKR